MLRFWKCGNWYDTGGFEKYPKYSVCQALEEKANEMKEGGEGKERGEGGGKGSRRRGGENKEERERENAMFIGLIEDLQVQGQQGQHLTFHI
ncbi:hypothetical protein M8J77_018284 [Diaphorina citri]|nr:hypothetical protein M8J77_018284 [Diaphorina citri]